MFNHLQLNQLNSQQQKEAEHFKYTLHCDSCVRVEYDLTSVSPVYSEDSVVHQTADSLIFLFYSMTDSDLSGVQGLISELKSEQQNLHL